MRLRAALGTLAGLGAVYHEVIEQHAAGKTSVTRESRPVGSVDESMVSGEADRIPARIVD